VLLAAGAVVVIALVLFLLLRHSGGTSHSAAVGSSAVTAVGKSGHAQGKQGAGTSHSGSAAGANAAQMNVVVLNGTATTGLAHYVSGQLRQAGFAHTSALAGSPPRAHQVTVVEYAGGHRADAAKVARSLGVAQPQPMEGTVASLSGSAAVVVIVGLDRASSVP